MQPNNQSRQEKTTFNKLVFIFLFIILVAGAGVRLWNISSHDMINDDALYSLRAVGYFDYVASTNKQSTPITWFAEPQWWQNLSFHDAPPLVFVIQWLFFKIGGDSVLISRLPFALAGILSIIAIFLLGSALANEWAGLIAAVVLSVMNYHVWISRIGLLESFVILWSILALYFFMKAKNKQTNYIWWGIFTAAGLMTKYIFLFTAPMFLFYCFIKRRSVWKNKWFYISTGIFLILISPVVIYNIMIWQTRGHFDAAISTMAGLHPDDFIGLKRQVAGGRLTLFSLPETIITIIQNVSKNMSAGFQIAIALSLVILAYLTLKGFKSIKKMDRYDSVWLCLFGAIVILTLAGASYHYTTIIIPFLALSIGIIAVILWENTKQYQHTVLIVLGALLIGWELFYSIQSQVITTPLVQNKLFLAHTLPRREGYNALESYVNDFYKRFPEHSYIIFSKEPQIVNYQLNLIRAFQGEGKQQAHLLVYDDRIDWFQSVWIFERRRLYSVAPIPSLSQFLDAVANNGLDWMTRDGFQDATIITTASSHVQENSVYVNYDRLQSFTQKLESAKTPVAEIADPYGKIAFKIFNIPLTNEIMNYVSKIK